MKRSTYWIGALGAAALLIGFACGLSGTARAGMQDSGPALSAVGQLASDIEMLTMARRFGLTAEQATKAADALTALADARDAARIDEEKALADQAPLLEKVRGELLAGRELEPEVAAAYRAALESARAPRQARIEALRTCAEALEGLVTPEQLQAAASGLRAQATGRAAGKQPADMLIVLRQWSEEEYTKQKPLIVDRLAGKTADETKKTEVGAFLDSVRALGNEDFEARKAELLETMASYRADAAAAEAPAAQAGDPFGPAPDRPRAAAGEGREGANRQAASAMWLVRFVRKMDEAKFAENKDRVVSGLLERAGGDNPPADAKERVTALLDKLRAAPEEQLKAQARELSGEIETLLPNLGKAVEGKARDLAARPGAEGKPPIERAAAVAGIGKLLLAGDPRHTAELLREYAASAPGA